MESFTIPAFNEVIKKLIGNYSPGKITILYGNAASGKTTSCLLASIACAKKGWKTIFIDTENSFDSERLKQLYFGNVNEILDNILLIQPKSFDEQHDTLLRISEFCKNDKVKLLIVDTIGNHYRNVLNTDPKGINAMMAVQLQILVRIARDLNKVVLLTNQVSADMKTKGERMVGGTLITKMAKCIIHLEKEDDKRIATLVKDTDAGEINIGKKIEFIIKKDGLFLI